MSIAAHADPRTLVGRVHSFDSLGRALVASALQSAINANLEEGQYHQFDGTITVTLFRNCFCYKMTYPDGSEHGLCRCHGEELLS